MTIARPSAIIYRKLSGVRPLSRALGASGSNPTHVKAYHRYYGQVTCLEYLCLAVKQRLSTVTNARGHNNLINNKTE